MMEETHAASLIFSNSKGNTYLRTGHVPFDTFSQLNMHLSREDAKPGLLKIGGCHKFDLAQVLFR